MPKPDMAEMMGAMGGMPTAAEEPEGEAPSEGSGEVSDEELAHAADLGFDASQAAALKRFVKSCMAQEDAGEYEETEEPAPEADEMGDM
jgi:hypothetical protein